MATFKKLKQVTLPVLKMRVGVERYFKITSKMRTGKQVSDTMGPAELVDAIDLETGELGVLIVPKVVQNEWMEQYKDGAYVGRCFSLLYTRAEGKRYNIPTIAEIEPPAVIPEFDPAAKAARDAAIKSVAEVVYDPAAPVSSDEARDAQNEQEAAAFSEVTRRFAKPEGKSSSSRQPAARPAAKSASRKR